MRASGLIVLVETNFCSLFLQTYFKKRGISIVYLRKTRPRRVTRRYSISIDELIGSNSQSDCTCNGIRVSFYYILYYMKVKKCYICSTLISLHLASTFIE